MAAEGDTRAGETTQSDTASGSGRPEGSVDAGTAFLEHACQGFHVTRRWKFERAQQLLDADPEIAKLDVFTAAATGDVAALAAFLAADAGVARASGGPRPWPPLLYLCSGRAFLPSSDPVGAARLLLDAGADPNAYCLAQDQYRFTAITMLIGEGEVGPEENPPHPQAREIAELLLQRGADPNDGQALYNACFTPDDSWFALLLAHGWKQGDKPNWKDAVETTNVDFHLNQAAKRGFTSRVALLLEHGGDPDAIDQYTKRTAYVNAVREGHDECARLLRQAGASSELEPEDHFYRAIGQRDESRIAELIAAHPALVSDPNSLAGACKAGLLASVQLLLDQGAAVDAPVDWGVTALLWSAYRGHRAIVELLVARGASLSFRESVYDSSAIGWASEAGHVDLVEWLLARSDDVIDLAWFGQLERLRARLDHRPGLAQAKTPNKQMTALHRVGPDTPHAQAIVELLLARGVDINAVDSERRTALDMQDQRKDGWVAELLVARGGKRARELGG